MTGLEMRYFVLKPGGRGYDPYTIASQEAILAYADSIEATNPMLAGDLRAWAKEEAGKAAEQAIRDREEALKRPKIVCLCGSTKFKQQFIEANFVFTMAGDIVLTVGWFSHADGVIYTPSEAEKTKLDELHLRKIEMADEIYVINVGGYVGESTAREIRHAASLGKIITWAEVPDPAVRALAGEISV